MRNWWFSSEKITCLIVSDENNLITKDSAPIMKKFVGQHIKRAANWFRKLGDFRYAELV